MWLLKLIFFLLVALPLAILAAAVSLMYYLIKFFVYLIFMLFSAITVLLSVPFRVFFR